MMAQGRVPKSMLPPRRYATASLFAVENGCAVDSARFLGGPCVHDALPAVMRRLKSFNGLPIVSPLELRRNALSLSLTDCVGL